MCQNTVFLPGRSPPEGSARGRGRGVPDPSLRPAELGRGPAAECAADAGFGDGRDGVAEPVPARPGPGAADGFASGVSGTGHPRAVASTGSVLPGRLSGMGINNRANRAKKKATRARQQRRRAARGSGSDDWMGGDMLFPDPPDPELLDTTHCPVGETCQGCGVGEGVHPVTAAFSGGPQGGHLVACASLCADCDGRSLLHLLAPDELDTAVEHHAAHVGAGT